MRLFPPKMKDSTIIQALMERHWQGYLSNVGYLGKKFRRRSTITQQLSKLLYSPKANNIFQRALQNRLNGLLPQLEKIYTKEEIITLYLNQFDFLYNAVGIKSAAHVYFNVTPAELNIEEAATLIGMCKILLYTIQEDFLTAPFKGEMWCWIKCGNQVISLLQKGFNQSVTLRNRFSTN